MPGTWSDASHNILGYVAPQIPANEEYVAVMEVQRLLEAGHSEREVALIWNTSLEGSEKPFEKKGKNKHGVAYNSISYAVKVMTAYAQDN